MAQGYGIGMSSRPLDLASGGLSFYQSAVQARRQEIKDHMVEASENEKMMLKAMDMKGLGEVAGKSRDRLDQEIQKFRSEMVEKYRKNQGKLSNADRTWLEGKSVDIQNNITATKNQLQALEKAKLMVTPDKWASYNDHVALGKQLAQAEDAIAAGDRTVNPLNIVMQGFRTPTAAEMISARYKDPLSKIDRSKITTVKGRTATINDAATEESLNQLYGMIAKDPQVAQQFIMRDEKGNPVVDASGQTIMDKELALNTILPMIQDKTEIRPATRAEMGIYGSGRTGTPPIDLMPTTKTVEGVTYQDFYPINVPMTTIVAATGTRALGTNEDVSSAMTKVTPVAISPSGKMAVGVVDPDGRPHPIVNKDLEVVYNMGTAAKPKEVSMGEVEKSAESAYKKAGGKIPTGFDNIRNTKYEVSKDPETGEVIISGTAEGVVTRGKLNPAQLWAGRETVKKLELPPVRLKPMTSTTSKWYVQIPISQENLGDFAPVFKKYNFSGTPSKQALTTPASGTKSSNGKKSIEW